MASLVADYGESSGDSDDNDGGEPISGEQAGSGQETKEKVTNFFGGNVHGGSDDSDNDKEDEGNRDRLSSDFSSGQTTQRLPNPFVQNPSKLPSPCLSTATSGRSTEPLPSPSITSSVFVNPFEQAEQAKLGILEKHVRLTEAAPQKPASKQLCWKFKKGRCHLGDKCRFFHDMSNIALGAAAEQSDCGLGSDVAAGHAPTGAGFGRGDRTFQFPFGGEWGDGHKRPHYHPAARFSAGQPADPRAMDEDNYMSGVKGKKRFGVTDSLVPPKRAMVALGEIRQKERPWTKSKK